MRRAGIIADQKQARRLSDYLLAIGINNRVDMLDDGGHVWIYDSDRLEQARQELAEFSSDPANPRYDRRHEAEVIRKREQREQKLANERTINVRTTWARRGRAGSAPVDVGLIVLCVVLFLLLHYGPRELGVYFNYLMFSLAPGLALRHLQEGEVWRLVTPILLHGSVLHLGFNMLWLYSLGSQIEIQRGKLRFIALLLFLAMSSNVAQYLWAGPNFLGMSGVVYGLFGYIWMQARYLPRPDVWIDKSTAVVLMVWLVICMTGLLGPIANAAHVGGLVAGVVAGSGPYLRRRF
jgi:GlpG protein